MPLFDKIIKDEYVLAIWELTEPESYFRKDLHLFSDNPEKLDEIHVEQRRREWLCSRKLACQLAEELTGKNESIWSDEHNKPHFKTTNLHVSISHATPYVAVLIHKLYSCGVDIEEIKPKLCKLSTKFLNEDELNQANTNLEALAIAWGAKEAIYKQYGRKKLLFKKHMQLYGLDQLHTNGYLQAKLNIDQPPKNITLKYQKIGNHILVFTV